MYSKIYFKNKAVQSIYQGTQNIFTYDPLANIDPDALAYITNVEAADGQPLEDSVKIAFNEFIENCKIFGLWDSIASSCILAGARTLSGALVPLKGVAPVNFNNAFVSDDYHRGAGLKGDSFTKCLSTSVLDSDYVTSKHMACYVIEPTTKNNIYFKKYIGGEESYIRSDVTREGMNMSYTLNSGFSKENIAKNDNFAFEAGLLGVGRTNYTQVSCIAPFLPQLTAGYIEAPAFTVRDKNIYVFAGNEVSVSQDPTPNQPAYFSNPRLSFYSLGPYLDLEKYKFCLDILMESLKTLFPYDAWIVPPLSATFVSYSIPLNVSIVENNYNIDQIGSNNPSLTCFRETNYDFIVNTPSYPFALRNSLGDISTQVSGSYNNDLNGTENKTIFFTPNNNTPDLIYYQCALYPSLSGIIYIKNY